MVLPLETDTLRSPIDLPRVKAWNRCLVVFLKCNFPGCQFLSLPFHSDLALTQPLPDKICVIAKAQIDRCKQNCIKDAECSFFPVIG